MIHGRWEGWQDVRTVEVVGWKGSPSWEFTGELSCQHLSRVSWKLLEHEDKIYCLHTGDNLDHLYCFGNFGEYQYWFSMASILRNNSYCNPAWVGSPWLYMAILIAGFSRNLSELLIQLFEGPWDSQVCSAFCHVLGDILGRSCADLSVIQKSSLFSLSYVCHPDLWGKIL